MMDRKILVLMLTLITGNKVSRPQDLVVSQPSSAQATEGGSVTLRCSYKSTFEIKVGSYWWVKDPDLVVKSTSQEFTGRVNCTSDQGFLLEKRADIEIRNLRLNDAGMYRCVVNIHGQQETSGKGTELQVTEGGSRASGLVVSQPSVVQGIEGSSVTLHCSYNSGYEPKVGSYHWVKDQKLLVKNTTSEFMGRLNCTSDQHFLSERRADIQIWHLKLNDSGMYQCVVGIHSLNETSGNGTELQVLDRGALSDSPTPRNGLHPLSPTPRNGPHLLVLGAGVASAFMVSVAVCLFMYYRKTQGCQAKVPSFQCPQQDHTAELNYTEIIVQAGQNPVSQREVVMNSAVDTQDGCSFSKSGGCSPHHSDLCTYSSLQDP